MSQQIDLRLVLSDALHTNDLSLEHDTMVVSVELAKEVTDAISAAALAAASTHTPVAELARASG